MTAPDRPGTPDGRSAPETAGQAPREQVIARLAAAFGPHKAAVSRKPDEDHRHPWTEFIPSGDNERGSTLIIYRDTDGENSMRALTYGEIADALCQPPAAIAAAAPAPDGLRERIEAALNASMDRCARCKTCDVQVDAVMAVLAAAAPAPQAAPGSLRATEPSKKSAIELTVAERLGLLLDQP